MHIFIDDVLDVSPAFLVVTLYHMIVTRRSFLIAFDKGFGYTDCIDLGGRGR